MNIKALIAFVVLIAIGIFGYSYYSSKKHDEQLAAIKAETDRVQAEAARMEAEGAEDKKEQPLIKTTQTTVTTNTKTNVASVASSTIETSVDNLKIGSDEKDKKLEMLSVYKKFVDSSSQLADFISIAAEAKGTARDDVLSRMRELRKNAAVIDTKGDSCASQSKLKLTSAIDAAIEATQTLYNSSGNIATIENAGVKIKESAAQAKSCMDSMSNI